jgi:hypothetical protein
MIFLRTLVMTSVSEDTKGYVNYSFNTGWELVAVVTVRRCRM